MFCYLRKESYVLIYICTRFSAKKKSNQADGDGKADDQRAGYRVVVSEL